MPRSHVDAALIARAATALRSDQPRYTARQLYYAVCSEAEAPYVVIWKGQVGLGLLLILISAFFARHQEPVMWVLVTVGVLTILVGIRQRFIESVRSMSRARALSYGEFEQLLADGAAPEGLVPAGWREPDDLATAPALVVCDSEENALLVECLIDPARAAVTCTRDPKVQGRPVVVVHDCSPRGCALPAELGDSGVSALDAGVRPRDLIPRSLQVIAGAPARLPRDLAAWLAPEEVAWLLAGQRLELAAFPGAELRDRIHHALEVGEQTDQAAPAPPGG